MDAILELIKQDLQTESETIQELRRELAQARAWASAWKQAAKLYKGALRHANKEIIKKRRILYD